MFVDIKRNLSKVDLPVQVALIKLYAAYFPGNWRMKKQRREPWCNILGWNLNYKPIFDYCYVWIESKWLCRWCKWSGLIVFLCEFRFRSICGHCCVLWQSSLWRDTVAGEGHLLHLLSRCHTLSRFLVDVPHRLLSLGESRQVFQ